MKASSNRPRITNNLETPMKKLRLLAILGLLTALLGCASWQDGAWSSEPVTDEDIAALATSRLNSDTMTAAATLSVSVHDGMATLHGVVPDRAVRQRAVQILKGTPGIFDVLDRTRLR